ncbi:MAG TPA: ABC transporter permease [Methylomirabilota bacterium]
MSWPAESFAGRAVLAGPWTGEWVRLTAFAYRNLIMARRNVFFLFELTFWPGVAMLSHGLLTRFLALTPEMTAFILLGTVALSAVQVCQLDVAYAVLFDIWSKSMKHQFLTPVRIHHLALGSWLVGVGRGIIVWALMALIGGRAFGFDFVRPGALRVTLFLLGCFLTALVIGLLVCALVLLFGTRAETSAWAAVNFFVMLAGIYYPISVLPGWVAVISGGIPLTYFLDGIRAGYGFTPRYAHPFVTGLALSLLYAVLAHWVLAAAVTRSRRTGLLLKLSE